MTNIAVINGPNLNLLGKREVQFYGSKDLNSINQDLVTAFSNKANLTFFQSNHEGAIIDKIHEAANVAGIVINPAALTHTSVAIRDAIVAVGIPVIEVHISNIYARESFRRQSVISEVCTGVISGLGAYGYHLAIEALLKHIKK